MKRVVPWLLTFIVCTPNVLSGVETVNALTRDKKEQTKISDVKFSKDAIHSQEKMDLSFKIEKPKESPLERTYSIPKDIEHSLIPTKSKYVIKQKKKEVGEIRFKKDKMMVQWKQDTAQQKIETDCTLEVKAHYYNDEEEMNKVKIGKEVTKILPATEPLEDENLLIQDIHYQPLERKKENQVVLDLKWPVTTELKEGNQYVFKLPKWMEAKKREISFKDEDKKNWFEAKIEKERITLKILKGKVYDPTVYRLPIVFRVNANQNEKVVQWMKRAIPLQKKSVAMDEIDTADVDTTKETKEEHKQSSVPDSEPSSTREKTRSVSLTSDSADDATSTTTTDIQDAIILSHQEVKEGATEQEEIKIRTVEELLQKSQRIGYIANNKQEKNSYKYPIPDSITVEPNSCISGSEIQIRVRFSEKKLNQISKGDKLIIRLPKNSNDSYGYLQGLRVRKKALFDAQGQRMGVLDVYSDKAVLTFEDTHSKYFLHGEFTFKCIAINKNPDPNGSTVRIDTKFGVPYLPQQTIYITNPPQSGPGESPYFYYKEGMMSWDVSGRIRWGLIGNVNQEYIKGKMYIKDYVQPGQKIDWDSFSIRFLRGNPQYPNLQAQISMEEFEKLGLGKLIKLSENSFGIVFNENPYAPGDLYWQDRYDPFYWNYMSGVNFTVEYATTITNPKQKYFDNKSEIYADYRTPYGDKSNHWDENPENNKRVENIFCDGNIDGDTIDIRINKADFSNYNKKLSDTEFTLINKENNQNFIGITNTQGYIDFKTVPIGEYVLQETKSPKGYEKHTIIYNITIDDKGIHFNNKDSYIIQNSDFEITMLNKKNEYTGPKLPNTGGDGYKTWFILVACTLILGTMILYIYKKKGTHT